MCSPEVTENCIGYYNKDVLDPIKSQAEFMLKALVVVGAILDVVAFKWRKLASLFLSLEMLTRLVSLCYPNVATFEYDEIKFIMTFITCFVCFYSNMWPEIVLITGSYMFSLYFGLVVVNGGEMSFGTFWVYSALGFLTFIGCTICAMICINSVRLHEKLDNAHESSMHLLNGMHEGILILEMNEGHQKFLGKKQGKATNYIDGLKFMFCNQQAVKLIRQDICGMDNTHGSNLTLSENKILAR